jgi:hypothetical protein
VLLFFTYLLSGQSRDFNLSDSSRKIKNQLSLLQNNINDSQLWDEYLQVFPRNRAEFKKIFDPDDFSQLYNSSEQYIYIFNSAPDNKRLSIFKRIISIIKEDASGCCDAWSALQIVATEYTLNDTKNFLSILKSCKLNEREKVIEFLADVENHYQYKPYQSIIDKLNKIDEHNIAMEFETARTKRMKVRHD